MVKRILVLLAAVALLIVPAMALSGVDNASAEIDNLTSIAGLSESTWTKGEVLNYYDIQTPVIFNQATEGYVVTAFTVYYDPGQTGTYNIHLNDGATVITGSVNYATTYWGFMEDFSYSLDSATHTFSGLTAIFNQKQVTISYAISDAGTDDEQYYIMMYRGGFWGADEPVLLYPISGKPSDNPIIQVDFTPGDKVPRIVVYVNSWQDVADSETDVTSLGEGWVDWVKGLVGSFWEMINLLWGIFSFFFIENLLLMILLIEGTILAYRFNTSRNVFLALSRTASDNQRLLTGLIGFIQMAVAFIWDLVNLINPFRWVFGK